MGKSFLDEWLDDRASSNLNLGESGVANVKLSAIFRGESLEQELSKVDFDHNPTQGSDALRGAVSALHEHAQPDDVLITAGASEAIFLYFLARRTARANVVVVTPAFHSLYDVPETLGYEVRRVELVFEEDYALPLERLMASVDENTKCVVITTPSNPMGSVVSYDEVVSLGRKLENLDCDILLDEQYRYLPHDENEQRFASPANRTSRILSVGSAGKCYGAVGLRVGWIVGPRCFLEKLNAFKALTSHAVSKLNDRICLELLISGQDLLNVNRTGVRRNVVQLEKLLQKHENLLEWVKPAGGTVAFPRLKSGGSVDFCRALYEQSDVLLLPGEAFEVPGHFRIRLGASPSVFSEAINRMDEFIERWNT